MAIQGGQPAVAVTATEGAAAAATDAAADPFAAEYVRQYQAYVASLAAAQRLQPGGEGAAAAAAAVPEGEAAGEEDEWEDA